MPNEVEQNKTKNKEKTPNRRKTVHNIVKNKVNVIGEIQNNINYTYKGSDPHRPKKPAGAFFLFMQAYLAGEEYKTLELPDGATFADVRKAAGQYWKELTPENPKKKQFQKLYEEQYAQYIEELKQYSKQGFPTNFTQNFRFMISKLIHEIQTKRKIVAKKQRAFTAKKMLKFNNNFQLFFVFKTTPASLHVYTSLFLSIPYLY